MKKKLLRDLKKKFPEKKFSLTFVEDTTEIQKETLIVNDKEIKYSWNPPIEKIKGEGLYEHLLKWCVKGTREMEWKKEVKDEKKKK